MSELSRININNVNYDLKDDGAVASARYNSTSHNIEFLNDLNMVVATLDATPFIKDGMVSEVKIENGNLVIVFNTDSGKQPISIPLTDIFNPENYYTKTQVDGKLALKYEKPSGGIPETDMAVSVQEKLGKAATAVQPTTLAMALKNTVAESGVYDVTANNSGTKFASLSEILSSAQLDTLIPENVRKGGMSIKFVQSSDNKYVQARLMADSFTTDVTQWQIVVDEPSVGSKNIMSSGGVAAFIGNSKSTVQLTNNTWTTFFNGLSIKNGDRFVLNVSLSADVNRIIVAYNNVNSKRIYDKTYPNRDIIIKEVATESITSLQVYATTASSTDFVCNLLVGISKDLYLQGKQIELNTDDINALNYVEDDTVVSNNEIWENGFYATGGAIDSPTSTSYLHAKVAIPEGTKKIRLYNYTIFGTGTIEIIFFKDNQYLSSIMGTSGDYAYKEFTSVPENATHFGYNRRAYSINTHSECLIGKESPSLQKSFYAVSSDLQESNAEGYVSQERIAYFNNCRITSYGSGSDQVISNNNLSVTVFLVQKDKVYEFEAVGGSDATRWAVLASNLLTQAGALTIIEKYSGDSEKSTIRVTPTQTGYLYVENYKDVYAPCSEVVTEKAIKYKSNSVGTSVLKERSVTSDKMSLDLSFKNKLFGKKWCPVGDSFTAGSESGLFPSGLCKGLPKVYPYFIRERTGIDIESNFFYSGRTLAYPADDSFTNSFTAPNQIYNYLSIPADADYITIYLGINDSHHAPGSSGGDGEDNTGEIPIGSINDNTVNTYYGAWNVVLSWLIENRPFAHIGIIVSNGCGATYRTAQLEIAEKYGIPYIDMNGDDRTPCMLRSYNEDISSTIRSLRTQKQAVDYAGGNWHPNDEAHEYESTFIEHFLMSL